MHVFLTLKGGVDALKAELAEHGIKPTEEGLDWAAAKVTPEQLRAIHVHGQTVTRVLELISVVESREALTEAVSTLKPSGTFCVRSNGTDRQELEEELGGIIHENGAPVNLTKPDTLYYIHDAQGSYVLGIDQFGDLAKRHYKIITGSHSLSGPFAACALRLTGWTPKSDLVVWPCATGELAIEAALWAAKRSPRAYELKELGDKEPKCRIICADGKLPMVRSAEKNAKVAGIMPYLRFSRQDADWLDTKYDEKSVTHIIGLLPNLGVYVKLAGEIIYQLDFILKKNAIATFICVNDESAERIEAAAKDYATTRLYLWSGKHTYTLVKAQKTKTSAK